jgi:hypothetical protein
MLDLDFLEIGSCDFDTLTETALDSEIGVVVEPVTEFLNNLPSKPNITKINAAIAANNIEQTVEIFYISNRTIKNRGLEEYLKGCAVVGKYHQIYRHQNIKHLVTKQSIIQIPIGKLLTDLQIRRIKHLKIDTEGSDCEILQCLLNYLKDKSFEYFPDKITFETNFLSSRKNILTTVGLWLQQGYQILNFSELEPLLKLKGKKFSSVWPNDTVLIKKSLI